MKQLTVGSLKFKWKGSKGWRVNGTVHEKCVAAEWNDCGGLGYSKQERRAAGGYLAEPNCQ